MEIYNIASLAQETGLSKPTIASRIESGNIICIKKQMKTKTKIYIPSVMLEYFLEKTRSLLNSEDIGLKDALAKPLPADKLYQQNRNCKVITVANIKGGVGKTVISANLAYSLAVLKKRVLMVDLDSQSSLSFYLNVANANGDDITIKDLLEDVFNRKEMDKEKISSAIKRVEYENASIDIIPSQILLGKVLEYGRSVADNPHKALHKILKNIKGSYDYVIIDTPPTPGIAQQLAIYASDEIVSATMPDEFSIIGLVELIKESEYIKDEFDKDNLKVSAVFINNVKNSNISKANIHTIKEIAHEAGIESIIEIPENSKISESITMQTPLLEYRPDLDANMKGSEKILEYAFQKILKDEK